MCISLNAFLTTATCMLTYADTLVMCISPDAVLTTASCVKQFLEETVDKNNTSAKTTHQGESKLDFKGVFVKILGDFESELSISDVLYHPSVNFDMVSFERTQVLFQILWSSLLSPSSLPPLSSLLSPLSLSLAPLGHRLTQFIDLISALVV
jgi:hypothetical protein